MSFTNLITRIRFFNLLPNRTFNEALPRTIASAACGLAAYYAAIGGAATAGALSVFSKDNHKSDENYSLKVMAAGAIVGGIIVQPFIYSRVYTNTNLLMTKFPQLKDMQTKFLIGPGIKPQLFLALTVGLLQVGIKGLQIYSEIKHDENNNDDTRKLKNK